MWEPAAARRTPRSCTRGSTRCRAAWKAGCCAGAARCCATTPAGRASRWSTPARCWWPGLPSRKPGCPRSSTRRGRTPAPMSAASASMSCTGGSRTSGREPSARWTCRGKASSARGPRRSHTPPRRWPPRRGELIVFDKLARSLVGSILLPVPTARTKGVLVAPTVYGNVLLGPTAEDVGDRSDTATTEAGLRSLLAAGRRILPGLVSEEVTAIYAGLRAATEHPDYQIWVDETRRYVCVGGIRSTGLSASLGIAEYVAGLLADAGLPLADKPEPGPPVMPYLGEAGTRPYADAARVAADQEYCRIVCHCERVTRGV